MIKHFTSSVFIFGLVGEVWSLGLIEHPRLRRWMIPGGHVEPGESQVDAALREVEEELADGFDWCGPLVQRSRPRFRARC